MSRNAAARGFGVSIANVMCWMNEYLRTGGTAQKRRDGERRSGRVEAQADCLMTAIEDASDISLAELCERLIEEHGETFAISTTHKFFRRRRINRPPPRQLDQYRAQLVGNRVTGAL